VKDHVTSGDRGKDQGTSGEREEDCSNIM